MVSGRGVRRGDHLHYCGQGLDRSQLNVIGYRGSCGSVYLTFGQVESSYLGFLLEAITDGEDDKIRYSVSIIELGRNHPL